MSVYYRSTQYRRYNGGGNFIKPCQSPRSMHYRCILPQVRIEPASIDIQLVDIGTCSTTSYSMSIEP